MAGASLLTRPSPPRLRRLAAEVCATPHSRHTPRRRRRRRRRQATPTALPWLQWCAVQGDASRAGNAPPSATNSDTIHRRSGSSPALSCSHWLGAVSRPRPDSRSSRSHSSGQGLFCSPQTRSRRRQIRLHCHAGPGCTPRLGATNSASASPRSRMVGAHIARLGLDLTTEVK